MQRLRLSLVLGIGIAAMMLVLSTSLAFGNTWNAILTATPSSTPNPVVRIAADDVVTVYRGPGFGYQRIGNLSNAVAGIISISPDRSWYRIHYGLDSGWVAASQVTLQGDITYIPVEQVSPHFDNADLSPTAPITPIGTPIPSYTLPPRTPLPFASPTHTPSPFSPRPSLTPSPTAAGNVQMRLAPLLPANGYTQAQLQQSVEVMRARLTYYGIYDAEIEIKTNDEIVIEFVDNSRLVFLTSLLTREGNIEIIDLSAQTLDDREALLGTIVITDRYLARLQMRYNLQQGDAPTLVPTPISTVPHTFNQATGEPYVSLFDNVLMTSGWVDYQFGGSPNLSIDTWAVVAELSEEAQRILNDYATAHRGRLIGIAVDSVLMDALVVDSVGRTLTWRFNNNASISEQDARELAAIAMSGPIPIPMQVLDIQLMG
jgi:hypothetical protein